MFLCLCTPTIFSDTDDTLWRPLFLYSNTFAIRALRTISGTIPTEIGLLTKIVFFQISGCDMSGTIPTELGRLPASSKLMTSQLGIVSHSLIHNIFFSTIVHLISFSLYLSNTKKQCGLPKPSSAVPCPRKSAITTKFKT